MEMIFNNLDVRRQIDQELKTLDEIDAQYVCEPTDFADDLSQFVLNGGAQSGESLPWAKADDLQKLRPGELSIWAGINGHGKSNLLGQVMLTRAKNQRILIASLEMKPHQTLYRMICQYAGCKASHDFTMEVLGRLQNRIWIYNQLDTVPADRILALTHFAKREMEIDHVVIDSLMKCGIGPDDYTGQAKFTHRLQNSAKKNDTHIHLVCHIRKGKSEDDRVGKFDIKGGGEITDIADNVFIVQRNKAKERIAKRYKAGETLSEIEHKQLDKPDAFLRVEKNRHGCEEGALGLFFHKESGQYLPGPYSPIKGVMPAPF